MDILTISITISKMNATGHLHFTFSLYTIIKFRCYNKNMNSIHEVWMTSCENTFYPQICACGSYVAGYGKGSVMKDTKSWILDAATILFSKNGYTRTTTRAISELAGVSESTFFRNFKSKDALLTDLLFNMTPGAEDIDVTKLTNGKDLHRDFEVFLYYNATLHIRHLPVFRLALHVDEIYDQARLAKIQSMINQMGEYFQILNKQGIVIDFNYFALAEHINSLVLIKASEFITGEIWGVPSEKSVQNFAKRYADYFTDLLTMH